MSKGYIPYSNHSCLELVNARLLSGRGIEFVSATFVNTAMYFKVVSEHMCVNKAFPDPNIPDVTKMGLVIRNGMAGNAALSVDHFVYRLLCSNGLIMQTLRAKSSRRHSGNEESFEAAVSSILRNRTRDMKTLQNSVHRLMGIPFMPQTFHRLKGFRKLEQLQFISLPEHTDKTLENYTETFDKLVDDLKFSRQMFRSSWRNQATMFDLINVLTEKAQKHRSPRARIEFEEKAGNMATWVLQNATKFK